MKIMILLNAFLIGVTSFSLLNATPQEKHTPPKTKTMIDEPQPYTYVYTFNNLSQYPANCSVYTDQFTGQDPCPNSYFRFVSVSPNQSTEFKLTCSSPIPQGGTAILSTGCNATDEDNELFFNPKITGLMSTTHSFTFNVSVNQYPYTSSLTQNSTQKR